MNKRRDKRIKKKLMVSYNEEGFEELGVTSDISRQGMCVASEKEVIPPKEIELSIAVPGDVFTLRGEVVWCKQSNDGETDIPDSMGIKIIEAPADYLNYVEFVKHQHIKPGEPEF